MKQIVDPDDFKKLIEKHSKGKKKVKSVKFDEKKQELKIVMEQTMDVPEIKSLLTQAGHRVVDVRFEKGELSLKMDSAEKRSLHKA